MTYSIVFRHQAPGELGVAIQTCAFAVGWMVPWARAGVGAVATQAMAEPAYGSWCRDALASGATAPEALAAAMRHVRDGERWFGRSQRRTLGPFR